MQIQGFGSGHNLFSGVSRQSLQAKLAEMQSKLADAGISPEQLKSAMFSGGKEAVQELMSSAGIEAPSGSSGFGGIGGSLGGGGFSPMQLLDNPDETRNQFKEFLMGSGIDMEQFVTAKENRDFDALKSFLDEAGVQAPEGLLYNLRV